VIDLLTDELYRVTKPNGLIVLAGFVGDRTPTRIHPETVTRLNDWQCWLCRPESIQLSEHYPQATLQPFPEQWW